MPCLIRYWQTATFEIFWHVPASSAKCYASQTSSAVVPFHVRGSHGKCQHRKSNFNLHDSRRRKLVSWPRQRLTTITNPSPLKELHPTNTKWNHFLTTWSLRGTKRWSWKEVLSVFSVSFVKSYVSLNWHAILDEFSIATLDDGVAERYWGMSSVSFNKLLSLYSDNAPSYMSCSILSTKQFVTGMGALLLDSHTYSDGFWSSLVRHSSIKYPTRHSCLKPSINTLQSEIAGEHLHHASSTPTTFYRSCRAWQHIVCRHNHEYFMCMDSVPNARLNWEDPYIWQ